MAEPESPAEVSSHDAARMPWSLVDWLAWGLATGVGIGHIPPRTATLGTLWGIPLAIGLWTVVAHLVGQPQSHWVPICYTLALLPLWLVGVWACGRTMELLDRDDPKEVVLDEYATLPLVYVSTGIADWRLIAIGFTLHRIFDIAKPWGIRRLESLPGGWGIMADDIAAATVAALVLATLRYQGIV